VGRAGTQVLKASKLNDTRSESKDPSSRMSHCSTAEFMGLHVGDTEMSEAIHSSYHCMQFCVQYLTMSPHLLLDSTPFRCPSP
jgi:hypothetical protein